MKRKWREREQRFPIVASTAAVFGDEKDNHDFNNVGDGGRKKER